MEMGQTMCKEDEEELREFEIRYCEDYFVQPWSLGSA
jgi:hypothetical protein